jgi:hypothetical protein
MKGTDQILEYLDGPLRENRYHRTALDEVKLGDATTDQIGHYLACRRQMENTLDEESVFDQLCRLSLQADDETADVFDRIHVKAQPRDLGPCRDQGEGRLDRIRAGMLEDGWAEYQVTYGLSMLGATT